MPSREPKAKLGPEPLLISRKEVEALYELLEAVAGALQQLGVDYIVTGGSLLGAVRQHSVLFCDDDIDIAVIDRGLEDKGGQGGSSAYERVRGELQGLLGPRFKYSVRPWEGGDKVRLCSVPSVFLDIFTLRRFDGLRELELLLGTKKNGSPHSAEYVQGIVSTVQRAAALREGGKSVPLCPFWHFNTRKAVEMWPKEVYRESELFPLQASYKMGPLVGIKGPFAPVRLLTRAFGADCFHVYYQSASHNTRARPGEAGRGKAGKGANDSKQKARSSSSSSSSSASGGRGAVLKTETRSVVKVKDRVDGNEAQSTEANSVAAEISTECKKVCGGEEGGFIRPAANDEAIGEDGGDGDRQTAGPMASDGFSPLVQGGGTWEGARKALLLEEHYVPTMPLARSRRRLTRHGKQQLLDYLEQQALVEDELLRKSLPP